MLLLKVRRPRRCFTLRIVPAVPVSHALLPRRLETSDQLEDIHNISYARVEFQAAVQEVEIKVEVREAAEKDQEAPKLVLT